MAPPRDRIRPPARPPRRPAPEEREVAGQARLAALVMAGTMVAWMGAQWLGGRLGWEARFVFLFDLAALAAFVWALAVTWRVWRRRQDN